MRDSHEQRVLQGRMGAHIAHSRHSGQEMTANARKAFSDRFTNQARREAPAGTSEPEILRRAEHLKKAYMTDMARRKAAKRPFTDCPQCARNQGRQLKAGATEKLCANHQRQTWRRAADTSA